LVLSLSDAMNSPVCLREIRALVFIGVGIRSSCKRKRSDMTTTTVAVDLAKSVFQLAVADEHWCIFETQRLTRTQFERWFVNRPVSLILMEACGSGLHWARWLNTLGIEVRLLPAQYVRAYVRRNKTDACDAAALLEAARASDVRPVRVKSVEQKALQSLHRIRSLWMGTRTSRINALRGLLREFGIAVPVGAPTGLEAISRVLADPASAVPELIRGSARLLMEEIRLLEAHIAQLERELTALVSLSPACTTLLSIPGIGLLTATALVAATSGDVTHFKDARHFASWFGLTPREHSSGSSRFQGKISKRGDRYLRMLRAAKAAEREVCGVRRWALDVQRRSNHNKAACALASKLARICYATLRYKTPFGETERLNKKITQETFVIPA
jgi:transposase